MKMLTDLNYVELHNKKGERPDKAAQTFGGMLLALLHLDQLLPDAARRVHQLVKPFELHRVLRLLVV